MAKISRALVLGIILGLLTLTTSNTVNDDTQSISEQISGDSGQTWRDYEYTEFWQQYNWIGQNSAHCKNKCIAGQICVVPVGQPNSKTVCKSICGDGLLIGEELQAGWCDDGNRVSGDGCYHCHVQANYICSGAPSACRKCGNGVVEANEACDDGNTVNGDGCSACAIDVNYQCSGAPSVCTNCGNGVLEANEACDDGNTVNGDGCSACAIDATYICSGAPSVCTRCGNGALDNNEACDDGNTVNGDGCSACAIDATYVCQGAPSVCFVPVCGNGIVEPGQYCEAGPQASIYGCINCQAFSQYWTCTTTAAKTSICTKTPHCGDFQWDGDMEQCDENNVKCVDCQMVLEDYQFYCDCPAILYTPTECVCA